MQEILLLLQCGLPSCLQVFDESDMLKLSGTIQLGEDVSLTINCTVGNQYNKDTENTLISLCGKKKQCIATHICMFLACIVIV